MTAAPPRAGVRWACVDIPAFPLQVLVRDHRDWAGRPAAVVDRDHPQGRILQVNEAARAARVLPGMRHAAALLVCRDLAVAGMPAPRVEREVERLTALLRRHAPSVEPSREEPGVAWLNAAGMTPLHRSLDAWAEGVVAALAAEGLAARIAVGFTRLGALAAARAAAAAGAAGDTGPGGAPSAGRVRVFADAAEEAAFVRGAPLAALPVAPDLRDALARLGVRTVGEFLALPGEGVLRRFGEEAYRLHGAAAGGAADGLAAAPAAEEFRAALGFEFAEADTARLVRAVGDLLRPLLERAARGRRAARAVDLRFRLDGGGEHAVSVRPAAPTTDRDLLGDLVRRRIEATALPAGVTDVDATLVVVEAREAQEALFAERPRRDAAAAARALARLRADLGDDAVVVARLREGHLPEAAFLWERIPDPAGSRPPAGASIPRPSPSPAPPPPLVRRILSPPRPLRPPSGKEPDGWIPADPAAGPVVRRHGPYTVSGGWWVRRVHREYHYVETQRGDVLWVFHDRVRRRWFLHGRVE